MSVPPQNQIILPAANEMELLANSIKEWRTLTDECRGLKEHLGTDKADQGVPGGDCTDHEESQCGRA